MLKKWSIQGSSRTKLLAHSGVELGRFCHKPRARDLTGELLLLVFEEDEFLSFKFAIYIIIITQNNFIKIRVLIQTKVI